MISSLDYTRKPDRSRWESNSKKITAWRCILACKRWAELPRSKARPAAFMQNAKRVAIQEYCYEVRTKICGLGGREPHFLSLVDHWKKFSMIDEKTHREGTKADTSPA